MNKCTYSVLPLGSSFPISQNNTHRFFTLVSSNAIAMWLFLESPNCLLPIKRAGADSAAQGPCKITQERKRRLWTLLLKNLILLSNCFFYFCLMFLCNLRLLKKKKGLLSLYSTTSEALPMKCSGSGNPFSYPAPLNCQIDVLKNTY